MSVMSRPRRLFRLHLMRFTALISKCLHDDKALFHFYFDCVAGNVLVFYPEVVSVILACQRILSIASMVVPNSACSYYMLMTTVIRC